MGADVYFITRNKLNIPKKFYENEYTSWMLDNSSDNEYYFRDSYNLSNLLNLADFSYWQTSAEIDELYNELIEEGVTDKFIIDKIVAKYIVNKIKEALDKLTNDFIKEYIKDNERIEKKDKKSWVEYFKIKRDYLRFIIENGDIIKIKWSV